jgi:hypothetical protein
MTEFHQFATYFALIFGTLSVVGVCVYAVVRCIRQRRYLAGWNFLFLMGCWFLANKMLLIVLYVIATPNAATPTHPAEYAVAPVYLVVAALVCYAVLRYVKRHTQSKDEQSLLTEHIGSHSDDDEKLIQTQFENHSFLARTAEHKKKISGVVVIAIAVVSMRYGFILESVLFVVVGVSLIMDVRIWRR